MLTLICKGNYIIPNKFKFQVPNVLVFIVFLHGDDEKGERPAVGWKEGPGRGATL